MGGAFQAKAHARYDMTTDKVMLFEIQKETGHTGFNESAREHHK